MTPDRRTDLETGITGLQICPQGPRKYSAVNVDFFYPVCKNSREYCPKMMSRRVVVQFLTPTYHFHVSH